MTSKQKAFILEKLIPFILREQGRGFAMAFWDERGDNLYLDGRHRFRHPNTERLVPFPKCGSVCCIGGSIAHLKHRGKAWWAEFGASGAAIGLDEDQSEMLFSEDIKWPEPYRSRYNAAKTPLGQAKAAVALLREVVRTEGRCLDSCAPVEPRRKEGGNDAID